MSMVNTRDAASGMLWPTRMAQTRRARLFQQGWTSFPLLLGICQEYPAGRNASHVACHGGPVGKERVVLPEGLPIAGEILPSHVRSIDTQVRLPRYAGAAIGLATALLVRAKLDAFITV
jgi:hypothetical protein